MNNIIINADLGQHKISRHLYGHFAEHLGRCIYGGFWVGEDSEIPNTHGIRDDVVAALRAVGIPNLRWPGGCFADEYHWRDGIGPKARRPTMINTHWGGVTENNHFGTHEFMELCAQLDCEPYICGNVGSGTVQEMQAWVEYLTFDGVSPMADLRRANGREDPWSVKFWGVGNENWGCGGGMRPEYYADVYRRFETYLRDFADNKLYRIACGANSAEYHWTEALMKGTMKRRGGFHMDALALHHYCHGGPYGTELPATGFDEADWFALLADSVWLAELIDNHLTIMRHYDPAGSVDLIVDEWGSWYSPEPGTNPGFLYQQNSLRDALIASTSLDIMNQRCQHISMANIAQTINVLQALILTEEGSDRMLLTPTYHVYEMYKVHHDATLLPMDLNCASYQFGGKTLPGVSGTASLDGRGVMNLTLSNLNPHEGAQLTVDLRGRQVRPVNGRVLTAETMDAHNDFDAPNRLQPEPFNDFSLEDGLVQLTLPPKAVLALELK